MGYYQKGVLKGLNNEAQFEAITPIIKELLTIGFQRIIF
jgi:hypothetical protein